MTSQSCAPHTVQCLYCGAEFQARFSNTEYCSSSCYLAARAGKKAANNATRTCPVCGKTFQTTPHARKLYCSTKCRKAAKRKRDRDVFRTRAIQSQVDEFQRAALDRERERLAKEAAAKPPSKRVTRYCPLCGSVFRTVSPKRFYCMACQAKMDAEKKKANILEGAKTVVCDICGEEFLTQDTERTVCYECSSCSPHSVTKRYMRKCHDCGRPTTQYRCDACRMAWRKKHGIPLDTDATED